MALTFPEILGDLVAARERYEVDGVQYVARFEPDTVEAGRAAELTIYAQNTLDQPVQLSVAPTAQRTGVLGGGLKFDTFDRQPYIEMAPAEAGTWTIPLGVPVGTPERTWDVVLNFRGQGERGQRVRPAKASAARGYVSTLLDDTVGLGITQVIGSTYESRDGRRSSLKLRVVDAKGPAGPLALTPHWTSAWVQAEMEFHVAAVRQVNTQRVQLLEDLGKPALYELLMNSAQAHLEGTGVKPHLGEIVGLAKILTYTVGLFTYDDQSQHALLVPVYMDSMRTGRSLGNVVEVLCWTGFAHLVRLAVAVSFNIVAKTIGRQPWSVEERRGVTAWVTQCLEQRMALQPEFLYLPLLLAALTVMPVKMGPDETPLEAFKLLGFAWQARLAKFKEDPELQELIQIFDMIARSTVGQLVK